MPDSEAIGLIPCGGYASRISPLPCSKEILPVGLQESEPGLSRPKVVSHYLLDRFRVAGVRTAFFVLRRGKWDIPDYYGDGSSFGMNLGYLVAALPYGPPYTLDQAYPFVRDKRVALGFPDILLGPADAFRQALNRLSETKADLVLGLYRIHQAGFSDMVAVDRDGRVREVIPKPCEKNLKLGWMFAVWTATFTDFLHDYLAVPRTSAQKPDAHLPEELTVGHVIQAGVRDGIHTQSVFFRRHGYLDIGSAEGLQQVYQGQWPGISQE